jgi:hypothetical protein
VIYHGLHFVGRVEIGAQRELAPVEGLRRIGGEQEQLLFELVEALDLEAIVLDGARRRIHDHRAAVAVDDERVAVFDALHQVLQSKHGWNPLRARDNRGVRRASAQVGGVRKHHAAVELCSVTG